MTCGNEIKIWPKPLNSRNQKSIKYFDLKNMKYQIRTDFQHVDILLHKAMKIFMTDIKQIVRASGGRMTENIDEENKVANDTSEIKINLHASQSDAILLTLETDECYSLSVSGEFRTIGLVRILHKVKNSNLTSPSYCKKMCSKNLIFFKSSQNYLNLALTPLLS